MVVEETAETLEKKRFAQVCSLLTISLPRFLSALVAVEQMCLGTRSSSLSHSLGSDWHIPDNYLVDILHPLLLLLSSPLSRSLCAPVVATIINCCGDFRVKKYSHRIYDATLFCVCQDSLD